MKNKKSLIALTLGTGLCCLSVLAITSMQGTALNANAVEKKLCFDLTSKLQPVDGIVTLKSHLGGGDVRFKLTGVNETGNGKVVSLDKGGTIENVDPIQNIAKIYTEGSVGGKAISHETSTFKMDYGYVDDTALATGKTIATSGIDFHKEYGLGELPSFIKLTAVDAIDLDKMAIDYTCADGALHHAMPGDYNEYSQVILRTSDNWNSLDNKLTQTVGQLKEWTITKVLKAGTKFKLSMNDTWDKSTREGFFTGLAFDNGYLSYTKDNGNVTVNKTAKFTIVFNSNGNDYGYINDAIDVESGVATLDETTGVKFAGGAASKELLKGEKITLADIDTSAALKDRSLIGLTVEGSNKVIKEYVSDGKNVKLLPVYGALKGSIAQDDFQKFNDSNCHGVLPELMTISHEWNAAVKVGDAVVKGHRIKEISPVDMGSTIRMDMPTKNIPGNNEVHEMTMHVTNYGAHALALNIYVINAGAEQSGNTFGANRQRLDFDLQAGESKTLTGEYKLNHNGNHLVLLQADNDMVNGFDFGLAIEDKKTSKTDAITNNPAEAATKTNVTFELPAGFKFKGQAPATYDSRSVAKLPVAADFENTTGLTFKGWERKLGYLTLSVGTQFTVPSEDVVLVPVLVDPNLKGISTVRVDYAGTINRQTGDYKQPSSTMNIKDVLVNKKNYTTHDGLTTLSIKKNSAVSKDDFMRVLSGNSTTTVEGKKTYKITYTFTNLTNHESKFELIQAQGGVRVHEKAAVSTGHIVLPAQSTQTITIEFTNTGNGNDNIIPVIIMDAPAPSFNILMTIGLIQK